MDKEREEKFFMLRLFRFVYQICGTDLPQDLQTELDKFPDSEVSYFNDSIIKAVLISMNERFDTKDLLAPIESDHFVTISREIARKYDPLAFLKFSSWYVMKAATDPDTESYKIVQSAIERVFKSAEEGCGFNSETWDKLDKAACKIVEEDYVKCRRVPNFDPSKKLDLKKEKAFVLRLMQHVFSLNLKELPSYYEPEIQRLDEENYKLSESVRDSLHCLLETQDLTAKMTGENAVKEHLNFINFCTVKFKAQEFLDYCACFSRQACRDYYENNKHSAPYKVHDSCVRILQSYRQKGLPIPWEEIEFVAGSIIEDNECRLRNEAVRQMILGAKSKMPRTELEEYVPLVRAVTESQNAKRESDASTSSACCSCCMCS